MQKLAVELCQIQLGKARKAVQAMNTVNLFEIESAWSDFLTAANRVYAKLEKGSRGNGVSKGWFGRKVHERKSDSLLRYIHHARNADEHGLEAITRRDEVGSYELFAGRGGGSYRLDGQVKIVGGKVFHNLVASNFLGPFTQGPTYRAIDRGVKLVRVTQSKDTFDPPNEHLGKKLTDTSPHNVATLAIVYLDSMIAEADKLAQ